MQGAQVLQLWAPAGGDRKGKLHCPAQLPLQAACFLVFVPLFRSPGQAACCYDLVTMENLHILGSLAAFTGRITGENVFAAKEYKYYREMLIFSLYDDYYKRYSRQLHYRALSPTASL